jgi:DnaJ-class molecular chaperone
MTARQIVEVECPECEGAGRVNPTGGPTDYPCLECKQSGVVRVFADEVDTDD